MQKYFIITMFTIAALTTSYKLFSQESEQNWKNRFLEMRPLFPGLIIIIIYRRNRNSQKQLPLGESKCILNKQENNSKSYSLAYWRITLLVSVNVFKVVLNVLLLHINHTFVYMEYCICFLLVAMLCVVFVVTFAVLLVRFHLEIRFKSQ